MSKTSLTFVLITILVAPVNAVLVQFNVGVDDEALISIDAVDRKPPSITRGSFPTAVLDLSVGWHDIELLVRNTGGSSSIQFMTFDVPGDLTNFTVVPLSDLRSLDAGGAIISGLRAEYYTIGATTPYKTVYGEGPIHHVSGGDTGYRPGFYQNVSGPIWVGLWDRFEERLTGQIRVGAEEMIEPVAGYISSGYGNRKHPITKQLTFHPGIDITHPNILKEPIRAAAGGDVVGIGTNPNAAGGFWIQIQHKDIEKKDGSVVSDVHTIYLHLFELPCITQGKVKQGDIIGLVGDTGAYSTGPHLHFEVREFGNKPGVDPLGYVSYSTGPGKPLKIKALCPIDLVVIDPEGYRVSKSSIEIEETVTYLEEDFDGDGDLDDRIWFLDRKLGNYSITVVPQPDALPDDTYSLEVTADGETIILAENVPISDIPDAPYIIRSTETDITQIFLATMDVDPDTLNLKSKGKWITCYIEFPEPYDPANIDSSTILLNGEIHPARLFAGDEEDIEQMLMAKFDRTDLQNIVEPGNVELIVTGELLDGTPFECRDTIRVR